MLAEDTRRKPEAPLLRCRKAEDHDEAPTYKRLHQDRPDTDFTPGPDARERDPGNCAKKPAALFVQLKIRVVMTTQLWPDLKGSPQECDMVR